MSSGHRGVHPGKQCPQKKISLSRGGRVGKAKREVAEKRPVRGQEQPHRMGDFPSALWNKVVTSSLQRFTSKSSIYDGPSSLWAQARPTWKALWRIKTKILFTPESVTVGMVDLVNPQYLCMVEKKGIFHNRYLFLNFSVCSLSHSGLGLLSVGGEYMQTHKGLI